MTVQLARILQNRGHAVHLIVNVQSADQEYFDIDVPMHVLNRKSLLLAANALSSVARRTKIELLFSVLPVANLIADLSILSGGQPAKVINTWHGYRKSTRGIKGQFAFFSIAALSRICSASVAVSHDLAWHLFSLGASKERMNVIYNGIRLPEAIVPYRQSRPYIFSSGSLTRHKDHQTLIRAFASVRDQLESDLLIAGKGPLMGELKSLAARLGVENRVRFLGFQREPYPYYAGASMFVLPSTTESFGLVLVEAMACGTPVVSTDSGGTNEVLGNSKYGRLVPPGNAELLAQAMIATASEGRRSDWLQSRARMFDIERTADNYERLCRNLTSDRGSIFGSGGPTKVES
jgi:glycosyltransferase involved in cell wall biosynthesis